MQRGSRCNEDQDAARIKMQRGSSSAAGEDWRREDQVATRVKMQRGSRYNEDENARRIKMQRGSRSNDDQVVLLVRAGHLKLHIS